MPLAKNSRRFRQRQQRHHRDSCFVTIAGSGDQSYYNYYNFTLTAAGLVSASAVSGDFTATLNLLDAAGNILAYDSGGGGSDAQYDVVSSLRAQLPAGSYRLQVFSDLPFGWQLHDEVRVSGRQSAALHGRRAECRRSVEPRPDRLPVAAPAWACPISTP